MRALLVAFLFTCIAPALATQENVRMFEHADLWDYVPSEGEWRWTVAVLPHSWNRDPPSVGRVWYRIRFRIDGRPRPDQSLYFRKIALSDLTVYVNQRQIWQLSEAYAKNVVLSGVRVPIPAGVLRSGDNAIYLLANGSPQWFQGLGRVHMGDTSLMSEQARMRWLMQDQMIHIVAASFGAIGLLALWLWLRSGRDPILYWYGISGVVLLLCTAARTLAPSGGDAWALHLGLVFLCLHGFLVPLFILHLRLAGRRHRGLEAALWLLLAVGFLSIAFPNRWQTTAWVGWSLVFAALPLLFTIPLLASPSLRRTPAVLLLVIADVAVSLLRMHDWVSRFGWIDFDRLYLALYAPPFVMLAAAVPIMERLVAGVAATRRMNAELERRVAAKAAEIEAGQDALRRAQREKTLAEERRRIMADMHDGLGSRLVSLLSIAQSGRVRPKELSEGIAAALDELRLTVDSVQPVEGDVGVVLGNVRHRMRSVFERAGVRFLWNVSALPRMDDLTPERILAIQRIFLEVFSNTLKHSGAHSVAVSAARIPGAVQIVIADDGRGFDSSAVRAGNGMANLRLRARQAGGTLVIESNAGQGTRVTLALPLAEDAPPDLPGTGEKEAQYPVSGMSPEPSRA